MQKKWMTFITLTALLVLAIMVPVAGAYETYADCAACHGNFTASPYTSMAASKAANPAWSGGLHNTHRNSSTQTPQGMLNGNCNACHSGSSRTPVFTNFSAGAAPFNQSCAGCHDGPGLRAHHVNSGADTCYDCHTDPAPDPENILRPVFAATFGTTSGTTRVNDPCNATAAGYEGRFADVAALGLDNDGNLMYDQNDPACAVAAPKLSVTPTTLAFGNQAITFTSAAQTVTISNTGNAVLNVTAITNSNTTDFIVTTPSTPFTISAGGSQTFTVAFKPGSTGAKTATVSINSNAGNASVGATGTGVAPVLGVSPTTLAFGNQAIGSSSAAKAVTISNTGNAPLTVSGITSSNAEFSFSPASITPIAPGGNATLNVTFTPAIAGARSANISILSNGGNASVSATGTGVAAAALSVSPLSLTYGNQTVGTTSASQTVTITNTGGTALTVNSITNGNTTDFVLTAPATPLTINSGATQTFTVAFKPAAAGAKTATISIASSAGNASVSATGTGVVIVEQPVLNVSPSTLTFSSVMVNTSATKTVTISNTGNAPLNILNITQSGSAAFSFSPASFASIAAGANVTLTITYAPTVAGTDTGSAIDITSNGGSATISLTGSAVQRPAIGGGDVSLVALEAPEKISARIGQPLDVHLFAGAATASKKTRATVTLKSSASEGLNVRINRPRATETIEGNHTDPKKFEFEAKVSCTKEGTWPLTWTATISAPGNSDPANDTLTDTTQVICSGATERETEKTDGRRFIYSHRLN